MGRVVAVQYGMMGPMNGWGGYQALLVVVILLLLAVIVILFLRYRPIQLELCETEAVAKVGEGEPEAADDKLEVALRLLDENERRVVEALVAKGGSMLQKDISYELGFSRVKAHRMVQSLVKRGLVTVEDHYNTKKVALVDWLSG